MSLNWLLYHRRENHRYPLNGRLGGPKNRHGRLGKQSETCCSCLEWNPKSFSSQFSHITRLLRRLQAHSRYRMQSSRLYIRLLSVRQIACLYNSSHLDPEGGVSKSFLPNVGSTAHYSGCKPCSPRNLKISSYASQSYPCVTSTAPRTVWRMTWCRINRYELPMCRRDLLPRFTGYEFLPKRR